MRIISGQYRSQIINAPTGQSVTRPTSDKVRGAIFNIIGPRIYQTNVLDLFAGSGALGIEALSRGAKKVYFNDIDKISTKTIKENLIRLKIEAKNFELTNLNYSDFLEQLKEKLDIVFVDPPYKENLINEIINILEFKNLLNNKSIIISETSHNKIIDKIPNFKNKLYKYGKTAVTIFTKE